MKTQDFGKYQLLKKLATGGMAEVWLARQTGIEGFNRLLVVKRILPHLADDPEFVQMFLNEAKIAARFNHPNIAQIYDLGEANGTFFIAMEFIHGEDLGRVMRKAWSQNKWIARPLAIRIVASACEGLYYAHSKADEAGRPLKVVHRDISPQNILVSFDGSVKVVDFGIAKAADQNSKTRSGAIKGKFAYMSPEQASGKPLDHRSDLFALGLVLYELLTGQRPLKRDSDLATLQAALACAIKPPSEVADVPSDLDGVVMNALAKSVDARYRDARAFQMALEELLVTQRWVATSVQISELMEQLFADRLEEEKRLGRPDPEASEPISAPSSFPEPSGEQHTENGQPEGATQSEWSPPPERQAPRSPSRERGGGHGLAKVYGRKDSKESKGSKKDATSQEQSLPPADVEPWEAPSAEEVPGRRRSDDELPKVRKTGEATAWGRTPSRGDLRSPSLPSALPAEPESLEELARRSSRKPSNAAIRKTSGPLPSVAAAPELDEEDLRATQEPELEKTAPRRRVSSKNKMASARKGALAAVEADTGPRARVDDPPEIAHGQRLKWGLLIVAVAGAFAMVVLFGETLVAKLSQGGADARGVLLTVTASPRATVMVRHAKSEGASVPEETLGATPLRSVRGAHLLDTVILTNPEYGCYYEETLKFGQPGEDRPIARNFKMGKLKLVVTPQGQTGLSVWRGEYMVGKYTPGLPIEMCEGYQKLELRGERLASPVPFEVEIKPGGATEAKIDVSGSL